MISIYTRTNDRLSAEHWKRVIKEALGITSGPDAVLQSLIRGLQELGEEYALNPRYPLGDTAIVLSGKKALADAIALKKDGKIKTLLAGPNIYVTTADDNGRIYSHEIDLILVPSDWVRNLWAHTAPELEKKITVWAAGVALAKASTRMGNIIIYDKLPEHKTATNLEKLLKQNGNATTTLTYGNFKQEQFFKLLTTASALIYLATSESQGLALQESWAHDVPTLVLRSGGYTHGEQTWKDEKINAPYLNSELGEFFTTPEELLGLLQNISKFHPKTYCDIHLSDKNCAKKLLELL